MHWSGILTAMGTNESNADAPAPGSVDAAIARLLQRWQDEGLAGAPATDAELEALEAAIGAELPEAFRALYRAANGTESYPDDWMMLLPLDAVAQSVEKSGDSLSLTFADFMESLYVVVLRLGPDGERVLRLHATDGQIELAPDVATFLQRASTDVRGLFA